MSAVLGAGLARLGPRVRARWVLEYVRRGLAAALVGATLVVLVGRVLVRPEWPVLAAGWGGAALLAALGLALARWPDDWATARAADSLGLDERATSALYVLAGARGQRSGNRGGAAFPAPAAAPLVVRDARTALAALDPRDYAIVPAPARWRPVGLAALALAVALVTPLPALPDAERRAAELRAVEISRASVREIHTSVAAATPEPLSQAAAEELRALDEQLGRAAEAAEAARAIERAQEQLAGLPEPADHAARRAIGDLAATWSGRGDTGELARALRGGDAAEVERALERLAERAATMPSEGRQQLQMALQAGANAARGAPEMAGALRQAAARSGSGADAAEALRELSQPLAAAASRASGAQRVSDAVARLGEARAGLGTAATGNAGGSGVAAGTGAPTGSSGAAPGTGGPSGGTSSQSGAAGSGQGQGTGTGAGSGSGAGQGAAGHGSGGTGAGSGAGTGAGAGSGSGSGSGQAGAGVGAGAGRGGGPSPGQPGSGTAGPTDTRPSGAPSATGATTYDPVYAPSRLGGAAGPRVQAPGDPAGASGPTVELPESPLDLGAVRPYDEVYAEYEAAARVSLARRSLPPPMQAIVQRYFSAIAPDLRSTDDSR